MNTDWTCGPIAPKSRLRFPMRFLVGGALLLACASGCSCSGPSHEAPLSHASYAVTGQLRAVPAGEESQPAPLGEARVHLLLDLSGDGFFRGAGEIRPDDKSGVGVDENGRFTLDTGTLEIEADEPPRVRALLIANLAGHAPAYRVLTLEPNTSLPLEMSLFQQHELRMGARAETDDGRVSIEGLGSRALAGRARVFDPLTEPEGFAGGFESTGGLLELATGASVRLLGTGDSRLERLESPATLRIEIPRHVWGSVSVVPPGTTLPLGDDYLDPMDCCIHGVDLEPHDAHYDSPASIPFFAFVPMTGLWSFEAVGTLETALGETITYGQLSGGILDSLEGSLFAAAEVSHFSQWAYGWPAMRGCVEGTLLLPESEEHAKYVTLTARAVGGGTAYLSEPVRTSKDGSFCIPIRGTTAGDETLDIRAAVMTDGQVHHMWIKKEIPLQPQDERELACGSGGCQDLGEIILSEAPEPEPVCSIDYLFPNRMWPLGELVLDIPIEIEIEIFGSGFDQGVVLWDIYGTSTHLQVTSFESDRLTVKLSPELLVLGGEASGDREITIAIKRDGTKCATKVFTIGGVMPDTGQMECFGDQHPQPLAACPIEGENFFGQDAHHGWDAFHIFPEERFRGLEAVAGEAIIRDQITQLQWQGCVGGLRGLNCSEGEATSLDWSNAKSYCEDLNWGGFQDWRLPSLLELSTLANRGAGKPSVYEYFFPGIPENLYHWTVSTKENNNAWSVVLGGQGQTQANPILPQTLGYAQCVRASTPHPGPKTLRSEETPEQPIVRDLSTGLTWQGCSYGQSGAECDAEIAQKASWKEALGLCNGLEWGGYDDWRLPSANELQSLMKDEETPTFDQGSFPDPESIFISEHWTSTSVVDDLDLARAWGMRFSDGYLFMYPKTSVSAPDDKYFRCVRGGPASNLNAPSP